MINKVFVDAKAALADVSDGCRILIGGFGAAGVPEDLVDALVANGARRLTIISNNAGVGDHGLAALLRHRQVGKMICSYPRAEGSVWFERLYEEREVDLELVPQGTLSERIRAGGAGIRAFYTRVGVGTDFAVGKESRSFDGQEYLLEEPITADYALIKAHQGDRWGNLVFRKTARNFGPSMAAAGAVCVAQVDNIVPLGDLDPESIVTPGIYVDRVVVRQGGDEQ